MKLTGRMRAARLSPFALPLSAWIAITTLPFALVCCSRTSSDAANASETPTVVDAGSTVAPSTESSTALTPTETSDAGIRLNIGARTPKQTCEQIRRTAGAVIATSVSCATDADCTDVYTSCGLPGICGVSVSKSAETKVKAESNAWEAASCLQIMAPPCPTCAMPPAPKCVAGKCS